MKMADIKSVICMATAFCLIVGFVACGRVDDDNSKKTNDGNSSSTVSKTTTTQGYTTTMLSAIATEIPELTCASIKFNDGSILFANSKNKYTLIDAAHKPITTLSVQDDDGNEITITCTNGTVTIKIGNSSIESFKLNGHIIEYTDNVLYYDKSKVAYNDKAFCEFKLTDDFTLLCTAANKFKIVEKTGTFHSVLNFTDDNGTKVVLKCEKKGVTATNTNDMLEPCLKINGYLMVFTDTDVIVNGVTMVPAGYYDIAVATTTKRTTTKATTTTTVQTSSPDETTTTVTTTTPEVTAPNQQPVEVQIEEEQAAENKTDKSNQNVSDITLEMLGYVNEVRRQYGLNELYGLETLDGVSQIRADELIQSYSHTRPDGSNYDTVIEQQGMIEWKSIAENIASGTNCMSTAREAFDSWMNSEGHRANILDPNMKYMAVAKSTTKNNNDVITNWEQIFYNDDYSV